MILGLSDLNTTVYNSGDQTEKKMGWAGHVARMGERRDVYGFLVGKPERKRPLGRPRCRCEDNMKMDLQDVGCGVMDWIKLAQDRVRWQVIGLQVP